MVLYILGLLIVLVAFIPGSLVAITIKFPLVFILIMLLTFWFNYQKKDTIYTTNDVECAWKKRGLFHLFFDAFAAFAYIIGFGFLETLFTRNGKEDIISNVGTIFTNFNLKTNDSWLLLLGLIGIAFALIFTFVKWAYSANANKFSLRHRAFIYLLFTCLILAYSTSAFILAGTSFDLITFSFIGMNYLVTFIPLGIAVIVDIIVTICIANKNHKQKKLAKEIEATKAITTLPLLNEERPVVVELNEEEKGLTEEIKETPKNEDVKNEKKDLAFKKTNRKQHKIIVSEAKKDKNYKLNVDDSDVSKDEQFEVDVNKEEPKDVKEKALSKHQMKVVLKERKRLEKKLAKKEKKLNKKIAKEEKRLAKKTNHNDEIMTLEEREHNVVQENVNDIINPESDTAKVLTKKEQKKQKKDAKKQAKVDAKNAKKQAVKDKKQAKIDAKNAKKQAVNVPTTDEMPVNEETNSNADAVVEQENDKNQE